MSFELSLRNGAPLLAEEDEKKLDGIQAIDVLLRSPFSVPRPNFFHAALEVPPLETAQTLPPGKLLVSLRTSHARSFEGGGRTIHGITNTFDGIFHDWSTLEISWGVFSRLEIGGRAALSGWDEHHDHFNLFDDRSSPIVNNEAVDILELGPSKRHENITHPVLKAKLLLFDSDDHTLDLSLGLSAKFPIGRGRDLTNAGTFDLNAILMGTLLIDPVTLHANAGAGFPIGAQNFFIREANVDINPFFHTAMGVNLLIAERLSIGGQIEFNTSAFLDLEFLEDPPLTAFFGVRKLFGDFDVEGGGGFGLIPNSSYNWSFSLSIGYLF